MRTITFTFVFLLAGTLAQPLQAQLNSDGSIYSRFGLGELTDYASSQIQGMGGGGTALGSLNYVNLSNPGSWSEQTLTRVVGGVVLQGLQIEASSDSTSRLNSGQLAAFQFSFPIRDRQLGAVISFEPYSRVAHRVQATNQIVDDPTLPNDVLSTVTFQGTGGIQRFRAGLGYRLNRYVGVGASADLLFGIIEESRITDFNNSAFVSTNLNTTTRLFGFTASLGALGVIPGVLGDNNALELGASVSLPATLDGDHVVTRGTSLDRDTLGAVQQGDIELPLRTNFGVAYHIGSRWTFAADLAYEPWSSFESELPLPGYSPGGTNYFSDRVRYSAGIEFVPTYNQLASFIRRAAYRIGFYYDQAYITPNPDVDFDAFALTGGFGLPTLFPGTRLDLNFQLGRRGSTELNYVRETFFKILINVNIGERWFERRKLG